VVLTIDTEERCLLLYPLLGWEEIERKLAGLPSFNPAARRIQRLLIGHATDIEMDGHGRILLPPLLREYAGLQKNAVLVGQGRKFELWDEAHWNESRGRWLEEESSFSESMLPDEVKSISL
jgi:MraZ protein